MSLNIQSEDSRTDRDSGGLRLTFQGALKAGNQYRNQYQTEFGRYMPIDADTHGFNFELCQNGPKTGPSGAIPTLASNCKWLVEYTLGR
jgi:hypothetical protein